MAGRSQSCHLSAFVRVFKVKVQEVYATTLEIYFSSSSSLLFNFSFYLFLFFSIPFVHSLSHSHSAWIQNSSSSFVVLPPVEIDWTAETTTELIECDSIFHLYSCFMQSLMCILFAQIEWSSCVFVSVFIRSFGPFYSASISSISLNMSRVYIYSEIKDWTIAARSLLHNMYSIDSSFIFSVWSIFFAFLTL